LFSIGVAGLIIAYELTRAGHEVIVYEASERAGGRFFTYDTGKTIIELGGMRLPLDVHTLTDAYVRKRFYLPLEPFVSFHPNTFVYINGIKHRSDNTSYLPQEYNLPVYLNEQNKVSWKR
jgi:monoamine oxidase